MQKGLHAKSLLNFAQMSSAERAKHAWELLQRIDSDEMGKGLYAQILADDLANDLLGDFLVPVYIRDAVLWACDLKPEDHA